MRPFAPSQDLSCILCLFLFTYCVEVFPLLLSSPSHQVRNIKNCSFIVNVVGFFLNCCLLCYATAPDPCCQPPKVCSERNLPSVAIKQSSSFPSFGFPSFLQSKEDSGPMILKSSKSFLDQNVVASVLDRVNLLMSWATADIRLCVWSESLRPFFLQVIDGKLAPFLSKVIKFASSHVFSCSLCREKGFICELCHNGQVLYPFQESTTKRYGVSFTLARSLNVYSRTPLQMMLDCHSFRFSLRWPEISFTFRRRRANMRQIRL